MPAGGQLSYKVVMSPKQDPLVAKAAADGVELASDRMKHGHRCSFGADGLCCRNCHMGPCRITTRNPRGVCGATADTIVARNFLRMVAGGAAAHAHVAREMAKLLSKAAVGEGSDYRVTDLEALREGCRSFGVSNDGVPLAVGLSQRMMQEFSLVDRPLAGLAAAPPARVDVWRREGLLGQGIDVDIVEGLHRTVMGVDHDYRSLLRHAMRIGLEDGWGSSRVGVAACDILFGRQQPTESAVGTAVLGESSVNVIVHGHNPIVAEMIAAAAHDPQVTERVHQAGATDLRLVGMCCTGGELLTRHGIPMAGHFSQQELAIVTGAVEMMITDVQCTMPSLPRVAGGYHTIVVTISDEAQMPGAAHRPLTSANAYAGAKQMLLDAADNFRRRDRARVLIPPARASLVTGFGPSAIKAALGRMPASDGGTHDVPTLAPLAGALRSGTIAGFAAIVGCSDPRRQTDQYANALARDLLARDVLVFATGCAGVALAKTGMLMPVDALKHAGKGLRKICGASGLPPVIHLGSCLDNARLLEMMSELAGLLGPGMDLSDLPVVGIVPEWVSEKVAAIACYFVASGIDVVMGEDLPVAGSSNVRHFLEHEIAASLGAGLITCQDARGAAATVMQRLDARRMRMENRAVP